MFIHDHFNSICPADTKLSSKQCNSHLTKTTTVPFHIHFKTLAVLKMFYAFIMCTWNIYLFIYLFIYLLNETIFLMKKAKK